MSVAVILLAVAVLVALLIGFSCGRRYERARQQLYRYAEGEVVDGVEVGVPLTSNAEKN